MEKIGCDQNTSIVFYTNVTNYMTNMNKDNLK
jgi:hypothetical protein